VSTLTKTRPLPGRISAMLAPLNGRTTKSQLSLTTTIWMKMALSHSMKPSTCGGRTKSNSWHGSEPTLPWMVIRTTWRAGSTQWTQIILLTLLLPTRIMIIRLLSGRLAVISTLITLARARKSGAMATTLLMRLLSTIGTRWTQTMMKSSLSKTCGIGPEMQTMAGTHGWQKMR